MNRTRKNYLGLDMSLCSPGVALITREFEDDKEVSKTIELFFWQQRKNQLGFSYSDDRIKISSFPFDKKGSETQKTTDIMFGIESVLSDLNPLETEVRIEGFAFGMNLTGSSSVTRLASVVGVVRHTLETKGFKTIVIVPPTRLKKLFAGSGKATKEGMVHKWLQLGFPDLKFIIGTKHMADKPIEDIVDSYALASIDVPSAVTCEKKKKKKKVKTDKDDFRL